MKFWIGIVCSVSAGLAGDASTARIQEAAAKAVAIIQKSQSNWYTKQSCVSCHHQVFPALAFRSAREHGIPVEGGTRRRGGCLRFLLQPATGRRVHARHRSSLE